MSNANSSPVSLPAGSYDYDALKSGLGTAARGAARSYDENVRSALTAASASEATDRPDPRSTPGYVFQEVEHPVLGVKENIQVYSPDLADEVVDADNAAVTKQVETRAEAIATADTAPKE